MSRLKLLKIDASSVLYDYWTEVGTCFSERREISLVLN